jgi:hypothetical protein
MCKIAEIVNGTNVNVVGDSGGVARGVFSVLVTETYLVGNGTEQAESTWSVVKRAGGDVDLGGNSV